MLIGAGVSFDPDVPSPAQFNHLITYLPGSGKPLWLDATPEAVPFQMLSAVLRGHKALVIPDTGAPSVMTTPEGLPFASEERMDVTGKLDGKGTLTAHFDWRFRGDSEVAVRSAFRTAGPAKWPELVQSMLPGLGFGGTASSVSVDNPANTDGPFHFSYDYRRETYSDWANLRIIPPFGRFGFEGATELDPPIEPLFIGAPGTVIFHASIGLPEGYSIQVPSGAKTQARFAGYESAYAMEKGLLLVTRTFTVKEAFLPGNDWAEYQKLTKSATTDETQYLRLIRTSTAIGSAPENQNPAELNSTIAALLQKRDYAAAAEILARAEKSNPRQERLWANYGELYLTQKQTEKAIEAFQKEIDLYPGTVGNYTRLSTAAWPS